MAEVTVSQLTPIINENGLKFLEYEGQILFSSEEIGRQLGYKNPAKSINVLFNRNQKELISYERHIKLMCRDGQSREARYFTEEGVYILSMLANTPPARDFRDKLARLLREIRERRAELAREAGYQQGRDEALGLPAVQAQRQEGYLAGLQEGRKYRRKHDGLALLTRALGYRQKGLNQNEIARLLGVRQQLVSDLLARAKKLGVAL
jgi:prophage antirepressor-like protein